MVTSTDELQEAVGQAQTAVATLLEQDRPLGQIAFREVLQHLLAGLNGVDASAVAAAAPAPARGSSTQSDIDDTYATPEQRAAAIARYLHIQPDEVEDLFDVSELEPLLRMSSKNLSTSKSAATREIALLVLAGRTAMALDTGTHHIRDAAERHHRLDPANFIKTLEAMETVGLRGAPESPNRLVRLKVVGIEAARKLAAKLTS